MKLINRLTPEHRAKLENLEYEHVKESIIESLQNDYVCEMTIGGGINFSYYVLDKKFDYENLHNYFNNKR